MIPCVCSLCLSSRLSSSFRPCRCARSRTLRFGETKGHIVNKEPGCVFSLPFAEHDETVHFDCTNLAFKMLNGHWKFHSRKTLTTCDDRVQRNTRSTNRLGPHITRPANGRRRAACVTDTATLQPKPYPFRRDCRKRQPVSRPGRRATLLLPIESATRSVAIRVIIEMPLTGGKNGDRKTDGSSSTSDGVENVPFFYL